MKQQQVYNLKEFAAKYQLKDIFGAYAAHIHTDVLNGSVLGIWRVNEHFFTRYYW